MTKISRPKSVDSILRRITLRELRLLLAVARAGSILKAAEDIGLTQPAVSRAVAELEDAVGVRLFDRTNRGVEATPQGRILLGRARSMFDEMRLAVEEIEALSDAAAGEIRVGGTPAMCSGLLAHAISLVAASRPAVRHQVVEMEAERLAAAIRARSIDLALGREPVVQADGDIAFEHLFDDHLYVVAGNRHPLATRRKLLPSHLANQRWLLPAPETQTYRQLTGALRHRKIDLPPVSVMTMSIPMRHQLLLTGRFLTAMHGSLLRYGLFPGLRVLPLDLAASIPIGLSRLKGRTLGPATAAFAEVVRSVATPISGSNVRELNAAMQLRAEACV